MYVAFISVLITMTYFMLFSIRLCLCAPYVIFYNNYFAIYYRRVIVNVFVCSVVGAAALQRPATHSQIAKLESEVASLKRQLQVRTYYDKALGAVT